MQRLSAKIRQRVPGGGAEQGRFGPESRTIDVVPEHRMAAMGEMDADLVGTAGLEPALQQAGDGTAVLALVPLQHLPMGHRLAGAAGLAAGAAGPAANAHRLAVAGMRMAADRGVDGALGPV